MLEGGSGSSGKREERLIKAVPLIKAIQALATTSGSVVELLDAARAEYLRGT